MKNLPGNWNQPEMGKYFEKKKQNNFRNITRKHAELVCTASSERILRECTAQSFSLNGEKLENLKMSRRRTVETVVSFSR